MQACYAEQEGALFWQKSETAVTKAQVPCESHEIGQLEGEKKDTCAVMRMLAAIHL